MNLETERKFLVDPKNLGAIRAAKKAKPAITIEQYYLSINDVSEVRIRIIDDKKAILGIKSSRLYQRDEFEYDISLADAEKMVAEFTHVYGSIKKLRRYINFKGFLFEVDEFLEFNKGLIIAELELKSMMQQYETPDWCGEDITSYEQYYNHCLAKKPYGKWKNAQKPAGLSLQET